jgi:peptidoglycan/xylan/chitin deacetylase (PgdA/CDA1 family)
MLRTSETLRQDRVSTIISELDRWATANRKARLWLRDDDACEPSPALYKLLGALEAFNAPCLLAVVPMKAGHALADVLKDKPGICVAMHGVSHANHSVPGQKPEETPMDRPLDTVTEELRAARARLVAHFGAVAGEWYVPPWNRIGADVASLLPQLGFKVLSTFGGERFGRGAALVELNTHVDIMNWRGGRIGHTPDEVLAELATALASAREQGWRPVGVLTHHLVHNENAWAALDAVLQVTSAHPAVRWCDPHALAIELGSAGNTARVLRDDFTGAALSPTSGLFYKDNEEQRAGTVRFQSDATREGRAVLELAVSPLPQAAELGLSERAELWEHKSVRVTYGEAAWYALSLKLDDPPPTAAHRAMVAQWKRAINPDRKGDYSPFLALRIIKGEFAITIDSDAMPTVPRAAGSPMFSVAGSPAPAMQRVRAGQTRVLVATSAEIEENFAGFDQITPDVEIIARGGKLPKATSRWIDFVFKVKAGPQGDGEIEIFADGAWIASVRGRIGHEGPELGPLQYFKFGPYRDGGRSDIWRVFFSHFARGPHCSDVAVPVLCRKIEEAIDQGLR